MKEMEAKTENRYEYRKPQEKRKQMIAPDLFEWRFDCESKGSRNRQSDFRPLSDECRLVKDWGAA